MENARIHFLCRCIHHRSTVDGLCTLFTLQKCVNHFVSLARTSSSTQQPRIGTTARTDIEYPQDGYSVAVLCVSSAAAPCLDTNISCRTTAMPSTAHSARISPPSSSSRLSISLCQRYSTAYPSPTHPHQETISTVSAFTPSSQF
jgi:hypothetical protein